MFDIIIFKNNKKKKKLKSFVREKLALDYFNSLLDKSNKIEFKKKYESGYECKFNIAIISDRFVDKSIYYIDEFGRNKVIDSKIDDANYIQKISPYFYEENIFDVKNNTKISFDVFKKKYFKKDKIHMVSKLKNKVVVQDDDIFDLFSLKNEEDADRFLTILQQSSVGGKMIIVKDISSPQRKYLYEILVEKGFDKKFLYTSYTTYPK
jgi:hypothetical protein